MASNLTPEERELFKKTRRTLRLIAAEKARRAKETADAEGHQQTEGLEPGATTEIINTENASKSINPPTSVEEVLAHWAEIEDDATYKAVTSGAGASNANTPLKTPRPGEGDKSQGGMASFKKPRTDGKGDSKLAPNQCRICRAFKKPSETWSDHKAECIKNQRSALDKKMAHLARLENQMEE
ncbi:hypothetical protein PLESTM_001444100 [Pleodorina starrii]|nr:hypothetical protein PLESTM_001444100 [Pleodorina starrii]